VKTMLVLETWSSKLRRSIEGRHSPNMAGATKHLSERHPSCLPQHLLPSQVFDNMCKSAPRIRRMYYCTRCKYRLLGRTDEEYTPYTRCHMHQNAKKTLSIHPSGEQYLPSSYCPCLSYLIARNQSLPKKKA
jgi:hypothetical protein